MVVVSDSGELNITGDMEAAAGLRVSNNNRQKLRQRFDIIRKLGQGTYGKVQLALNKDTGEEVAIKTIKKAKIETEQDLTRIQREIQIMSSVHHPHIIHIYEVFENKEKIVLVMEYASGGELYDYLSYKRALDDCDARRLFRQIVSAAYYCHKNKICHRDLKLENILLDEKGNAKIADFGLSNVFDEKNLLNTFCGSPLYASPEIVKGTPYYGPEVDCWSLGVLLYTLVYGAMPFDGSNFRRLVKQISEGDYYEPKQPSEASSLIRRMLTVQPSKRANIEEVCTDWWVNLGYQDSLLTVAEEMCQAMPVRLDYLLQLVPSNIPAVEPDGEQTQAQSPKANQENAEEVPHESKEMAMDVTSTDVTNEQTSLEKSSLLKPTESFESSKSVKKHDLSSSAKSLAAVDSMDRIGSVKKKKKKVVEKDTTSSKDAKETSPVIVKPDVLQQTSKTSGDFQPGVTVNDVSMKETNTESVGVDKKASAVEMIEAFILKAENNAQQQQEKSTVSLVAKPEKPLNDQNSTPVEILKVPEDVPVADLVEMDKKIENSDAKKIVKRKDSLTDTGKSGIDSQPLGRRGSKTIEEKKLLFSASKVSEARKAFEAKPTEKKSLVVPGMKVSVARKAFESSGKAASKTSAKDTKPLVEKPKELEPVATNREKSPTESPPDKLKESSSIVKVKSVEVSSTSADKVAKTKKVETSSDKLATPATPDDSKPASKAQEDKVSPSKEISLPSGQQKVTGFVPTLDVSMAVKPPKKSTGKPPAAPRTTAAAIDSSSPSSTETTPDTAKVTSSPLAKTTGRKASLSKITSTASGEISPSAANVETENETKKSNASSKDISGSESSFLARAFLNKNSDNVATEKISQDLSAPPSSTKKSEKSIETKPPVKVSSVEIQLNSKKDDVSTTISSSPSTAEPALKLPSKPGKFMLLGVKSEVSFAMEPPSDEVETVSAPLPPIPQKHQSLYMNVTLPPPPPATPSPETEHPPSTSNFASSAKDAGNVEGNLKTSERVIPVQVDGDASDDSRPGYSVYRSKFHSTHSSKTGNFDKERAPSLERSESLSSTGSTDDLEDIFDSLTSDSMLSGILNRTRTIIEELTRDSASRQFSSFFSGAGGSGLSGSSRMRSLRRDTFQDPFSKKDWFSDFTSGIGSSRISKDTMLDSFLSRSRNLGGSSWRSSASRMSPDPDTYLSDSGSGIRTRRNRNNSTGRMYDDDYVSDSGSRGCSNRRSAFSTSSSRSMSNSISEEENLQSENRYSRTNSLNEGSSCSEASFYSRAYGAASRRDSTSSTSSVSSQRQSWNKTPTSSWQSSSSRSTATNLSQDKHLYNSSFAQSASDKLRDLVQSRRTSDGEFYQGHRSRSRHADSTLDNFAALCGTIRRPRSLLRYTKSMTKDLSADEAPETDDAFFSDARRRRMHRPRSILVLADPDDDAKDEDDSSTSSDVSHERYRYPRDDISRGGGSASGRGNSRRDGAGGGSSGAGTSGSKSNYTFISLTSKGSGYSMHDGTNNVQDHAEHQKSPVDGTDKSSSSSATDSGISSLSCDIANNDIEANEHSSSDKKATDTRTSARKTCYGNRITEVSQLNGLAGSDESSKGAAGYWAKRYGSTCRQSSVISSDADSARNGSGDAAKILPNKSSTSHSTKYNEKWVGVNSVKNEEKADVKKDSTEDTLVGFARSVSVELDNLQSRLNQRFDRDTSYRSTSQTTRSASYARRLSLSGEEPTTRPPAHQNLSKDKIGQQITSITSGTQENCKIDNDRRKRENRTVPPEMDSTLSDDTTPTQTPTPTPATVARDVNSFNVNCPHQQNGTQNNERSSQEDRGMSSENEDSSSEALDSSASRGSIFEEESVSERIRRKSYFARFQDGRSSRKFNDQHRKSLDINRNHHSMRLDDFSTLSPVNSRSHLDYSSRTASLGRRNSFSHAFMNDDFSISQPPYMSVQSKTTRPCRNGMVNSDISDSEAPSSELQNGSVDQSGSHQEENGNHADRNTSSHEPTQIPSNGYSDTESTSPDMFLYGPRFSRHLSLVDNGVTKTNSKISNGNSTVRQSTDWFSPSPSPLEASNQCRASSRNRHDYIINRALSTLDDRVTRPYSPPSRLSFSDHLPDLRQFSAILDNSSPRDLLRKALDVCNSLQY